MGISLQRSLISKQGRNAGKPGDIISLILMRYWKHFPLILQTYEFTRAVAEILSVNGPFNIRMGGGNKSSTEYLGGTYRSEKCWELFSYRKVCSQNAFDLLLCMVQIPIGYSYIILFKNVYKPWVGMLENTEKALINPNKQVHRSI